MKTILYVLLGILGLFLVPVLLALFATWSNFVFRVCGMN